LNPVYRRLAGDKGSIWEIPEAQHMQGINTRPQEYEQRVVDFFDDALLGK
jgi:hypothetical protein